MDKTFDFTSRYGGTYEIRFVKTAYVYNNSLAVLAESKEPDFGYWEPYGTLTVNIGEFSFGPKTAYLDTNNLADLCEFVLEKGWAKVIGEGRSGFCTYPLVEFSDEFINEVCKGE